MAAGRLESPADVIERLVWTSTFKAELQSVETLYQKAFLRYLNGTGRVNHALLHLDNLTDSEKNIAPDDPLVWCLMFLLFATGSPLLPPNQGQIEASLKLVVTPSILANSFIAKLL
jgi:hypothetical protein